MLAAARRWLVTGASGRLGQVMVDVLADDKAKGAAVMGMARTSSGIQLDLVDRQGLAQALDLYQPTHIVHLAGVSSPAQAARDPDRAHAVNVDATAQIAAWAQREGAWMLFASSDMVFDGQGAPYTEQSPPTPQTFYGHGKADAEAAVLAAGGAVARLAWMVGCPDPTKDFLAHALAQLAAGTPVSAVDDEVRTPIRFDDAAAALFMLGRMQFTGIIHVGGQQATTAHALLSQHALAAGLDPSLVRPVSRLSLEPPNRPADIRLDSSLLQSLLNAQATRTHEPMYAQA